MNNQLNKKIPMWVNIVQGILILIMLQQVYMFFFDHQAVAASGISVDGSSPNLNLLYEFAARTATMAIISIFVMISQNPRYFIVILLMNLLREGQETIIDPLFPLLNAPVSPMGDLLIHIAIIAIELWAFITVLKIVREMDKASNMQAKQE
tara:strand:- start:3595 stop:4047 length:453 start_codon:yes stop_codon:yes gene_type:complete